jgi:hypothetical protein
VSSQPMDEESQQLPGAFSALRTGLGTHAHQVVDEGTMLLPLLICMARIDSLCIHQRFFGREMVASVVGKISEHNIDVALAGATGLCRQIAEAVDQLDQLLVLCVHFRQTGEKAFVPMKRLDGGILHDVSSLLVIADRIRHSIGALSTVRRQSTPGAMASHWLRGQLHKPLGNKDARYSPFALRRRLHDRSSSGEWSS